MNENIDNYANQIPLRTCIGITSLTKPAGNLFVGSLSAAESSQFLSQHNITHILTVAKDLTVNIPDAPDGNGEQTDVHHLVVECHDHPMANILEVLDECLNFVRQGLHNQSGNVLVHCASGVSRSVTVCAAYLMKYYQWNWLEALQYIANERRYANPNLGFRRQLQILQDSGGDLDTALGAYSKLAVNVVFDTIRQRGLVNELHAKVDAMEDVIAKLKSKKCVGPYLRTIGNEDDTEEDEMANMRTSLSLLLSELDSCLPKDSEGLADPPAIMIRKSALAKVLRLLDSI
jgi:protein-tyrosine phosphatase